MLKRRRRKKPKSQPLFANEVKPGEMPGTMRATPGAEAPVIRVMGYGPEGMEEHQLDSAAEVEDYLNKWPVLWINVDGLGDVETVRKLGELFDLHRLALEDVINVHQRPKVEQYDERLFVVLRMIHHAGGVLATEQVSLFLGNGFVITFQEHQGDSFDPVRNRIRQGKGQIRKRGSDYLTYALTDAVIDHYFPVLETYSDHLEGLEDRVFDGPDENLVREIHAVKKDLTILRRAIWPKREAVNALIRESGEMITDETRIYLRDCYDHSVQIIDILENQRELASGLMDLYMSGMSNRMNEVMKVLAVIATIFMPLSFIAGLYGMNFNGESSPWNLPELNWYWGYPLTLSVMAVLTIAQLIFFRRKGWIGGSRSKKP